MVNYEPNFRLPRKQNLHLNSLPICDRWQNRPIWRWTQPVAAIL